MILLNEYFLSHTQEREATIAAKKAIAKKRKAKEAVAKAEAKEHAARVAAKKEEKLKLKREALAVEKKKREAEAAARREIRLAKKKEAAAGTSFTQFLSVQYELMCCVHRGTGSPITSSRVVDEGGRAHVLHLIFYIFLFYFDIFSCFREGSC